MSLIDWAYYAAMAVMIAVSIAGVAIVVVRLMEIGWK